MPRVKNIDKQQFEQLMKLGCTESEVCSVLKTTDKTLSRWVKTNYGYSFSELIKNEMFFGEIKSSLRRAQFKSALGGNATMLIWLGKQYLGQSDKIDQVIDQTNKYIPSYEQVEKLAKLADSLDEVE